MEGGFLVVTNGTKKSFVELGREAGAPGKMGKGTMTTARKRSNRCRANSV